MKLVLFCDYGVDDAAATCDVFRSKRYDEVDVVPVGGNVPKEIAFRNAKTLLSVLGVKEGVRLVDARKEAQPEEFLTLIHGDDGMGDLFPAADAPAVPVLDFSRWLDEAGKAPFDLLSLGPMTLPARLLARAVPERFVFMAGTIAEEPNFHGYEFNHALDRAAFSDCARFPHTAVTMDTCRDPLLNVQPAPLPGEGLMERIVNRARELTFRSGETGCYLWDDIAFKCLLHPDWFTCTRERDRDGNELTVAHYAYGKPYAEIVNM